MSATSITIRADRVFDSSGQLCAGSFATVPQTGSCSANQVTNPFQDPSFDLVGSETKDVEITVQIGDMDPSTSDTVGVGNQELQRSPHS